MEAEQDLILPSIVAHSSRHPSTTPDGKSGGELKHSKHGKQDKKKHGKFFLAIVLLSYLLLLLLLLSVF